MIGSEEVVTHLNSWKLAQYSEMFVRAGYRQIFDLLSLEERDIRALGVTKDADIRRCLTMVSELETKHKELSRDLDKNWMDPDGDIKTWLEKRDLASLAPLFEQHKIGFEVLGDLAADDLRDWRRRAGPAKEAREGDRAVEGGEGRQARGGHPSDDEGRPRPAGDARSCSG